MRLRVPILGALLAALPVSAVAQTVPQSLTFVLEGGWKGAFASPDCRSEGNAVSEIARVVGAHQALRQRHENLGLVDPVVLHIGDAIFPGPLGRFLLSNGEQGADRLLDLLAAGRYDAFAIGGLELSPGAGSVRTLMERSWVKDFPWTGDNLRCNTAPASSASPAPAVCAAVRSGKGPRVITRGGLRIALLSFLTPSNASKISATNRDGLELAGSEGVLVATIKQIEDQNLADLVVLQVHLEDHADELALHALLSSHPGVDLAVTTPVSGGAWSSPGIPEAEAGHLILPGSGTIVIPSGRSIKEQIVATLDVLPGPRLRARSVQYRSLRTGEPDPQTETQVQAITTSLCRDWGRPIREDVPLSAPLDRASFGLLTANTIRHLTRSEVGILNAKGIRGGDGVVSTGHLALADVYTLLPFGSPLVRARISGGTLEGLAGLVGTNLVAAGLEMTPAGARANGRPIDWARSYTIVVDQFLADGGDGVLPAGTLLRPAVWTYPGAGRPEEVGAILVRSVEDRRFLDAHGALDPVRGFHDLTLRPLWRFGWTLDVSYMKGLVENPVDADGWPGYSQSELGFGSSDLFSLDTRLKLRAGGRMQAVDLDAQASYGAGRYEGFGDGFTESNDLIHAALTWEFNGLRALAGDKGFVPLPIVQAQLDSEFDRPEEREWHHLMLMGVAGMKVRPLRFLEGRLGANLRRELLKEGDKVTAGGILGFTLDTVPLFSVVGRPFEVYARGDWLFNDLAATNIHELKGEVGLYFSLVDRLRLTGSVQAYAYRDNIVQKWGTSLQIMLGLGVSLDAASQTF